MRVLGIDPGLTTTGYAVVEGRAGTMQARGFGVIRTPVGDAVPARLAHLQAGVRALIEEHAPEALAIERVFFSVNVRTAMSVAQAAGVVLAAAGERGLPVADYTPPEVKQAVAGVGAATKTQVQRMVVSVLGLDAPPRPADAADACALAICHLNRSGLQRAVAIAGDATAAPGDRLARAIRSAVARDSGGAA